MGLKVLGWISTKSNDFRTGVELIQECCSSNFARTYGGFLAQKLLHGCIALQPTLKQTRLLGALGMVASGVTMTRHIIKCAKERKITLGEMIPIFMQVRMFANSSAYLLKGFSPVNQHTVVLL